MLNIEFDALKILPGEILPMKNRLRKKQQRQAQQKAKAARQEHPVRPVDAGWQLFQAGQYREAIAAWKNAPQEEQQRLRPVLAETYFRLAMEQHAAGKEQSAQTFLQQAVNLAPDQWLYHYHLALAWQRLGNLARATAAYRQALAGRPGNQRVLLHLGWLMVQQELASPGSFLAAWLAGPEGQGLAAPVREFLSSLPAMLRGEVREDMGSGAPVAVKIIKHPGDNPLPDEPLGSSAAFLTGIAYARQEQWGAARTWLEQAVHRAPHHPLFWLALGEVQALSDDLHGGKESLEQAVALGAGEEARDWLAAVRQGQLTQAAAKGDLNAVIQLLEADSNPNGALLALAYFVRGNLQARNEQWSKAREDWERAVAIGPAAEDLPDITHNLALLAEREGRQEEAVRYWRQTISGWTELLGQGEDRTSREGYLALAYRHLAELLLADGNLTEAAIDLELALRYDPEDVEARLTLAHTQEALEEPQKAIRTLLPVVQEHPGNVEAVGALASLYMETEKYEAAKEVLRNSLAVTPEEPVLIGMLTRISNRLARRYIALEMWQEAQREIEETLRLNPRDPEALVFTGVIACLTGKEKEGEQWFQQVLQLMPEDPRSHLLVGQAYFVVGHPRKAGAQLKRAMDLAGNAPEVCYQAAQIYLGAEREKAAETALRRALDCPGADREKVYLGAFKVCCKHTACDLAQRILRLAIREFPQNIGLQLKYARCLIETGDERARAQLAEVERIINTTGTPADKWEWQKQRAKWYKSLEESLENDDLFYLLGW
ncbi:Tetratricopeptide TPR2 [Moorella glycerini]|uniref:Tetratricopeptide repeat protein n=1 Tax=Neomoorella stamsii TaxID=1266720 RepID=A0A9X7J292_9FIRM|nr:MULTISPECIES: tetratricopeptide repeat protein [Moorella]PRR72322.1 tetratricopeptide repeat protein [Moorella stamsii]CEP68867.1 Tetratricopeptide TPR2 [Moorella glycerini]